MNMPENPLYFYFFSRNVYGTLSKAKLAYYTYTAFVAREPFYSDIELYNRLMAGSLSHYTTRAGTVPFSPFVGSLGSSLGHGT